MSEKHFAEDCPERLAEVEIMGLFSSFISPSQKGSLTNLTPKLLSELIALLAIPLGLS